MALRPSHILIILCFLTSPYLSCSVDHFDNYIIHFDPSHKPTPFTTPLAWHESMLRGLTTNGHNPIIYSYSKAMNGLCANLPTSSLQRLKKMPGFLQSTASMAVKAQTTRTTDFMGLNQVGGLWPASLLGEDMIIGVVDTGIWPESESFGDAGFGPIPTRWKGSCEADIEFKNSDCNLKLIGAKSFNKALLTKRPKLKLLNSTRDIDGHGTHTASTVAGSPVCNASYFGYGLGTARGMAPKARVAMYKALWEVGADSCDIIAAIDEAIKDGVDVLSLSLGLEQVVPMYYDAVAIATFSAMENGIFVSASAGNEGPSAMSVKNDAPWLLTVAAGTIDRQFHGDVLLGNGVIIPGQSLYVPTTENSSSPLKAVYLGYLCNDSHLLQNLSNKLVVCETTNLRKLVDSLASTGVSGGVFICNSSDLVGFNMRMSSFPATFVDSKAGLTLKNYINKNPQTATCSIKFQKTTVGVRPAPQVVYSSSRGPSYESPNLLKPDITAPGSRILAAWPERVPVAGSSSKPLYQKFNLASGTSMACPHAAGVAALLKGARPDWSPAAIRSALMTTADVVDNSGFPISEENGNVIANPFAMGSGHINPNKALDPGLIYDIEPEDYVSHLCSLPFTPDQFHVITRRAYNCTSAFEPFQLNYPSFMSYINLTDFQPGLVHTFVRTLTNVGAPGVVYSATMTEIDGFEIEVVPDILCFGAYKEKREFKLNIVCKRLPVDPEFVKFGHLTWVENSPGKHTVKSPLLITGST